MGLISNISDFIYVMYDGYLMEKGKVKDIIKHSKHPYTQGLISSIPKSNVDGKLFTIGGSIQNPLYKNKGCPFYKRCRKTLPICKNVFPEQTIVNEFHSYFCHNIGE